MKTVGIICPNCSKIFQYDSDNETALCKSCGHELVTKEQMDDKSKAEWVELKKLLDGQINGEFNCWAINDITNRMLGINIHDSDTWVYKGMASSNVSTKAVCYFKAVQYMEISEYEDLFESFSEDIASAIQTTDKADWNPFDISDLDIEFRARKPESVDKDDFLLDVMNKLRDLTLQTEENLVARKSIAGYVSLATVTTAIYCNLPELSDILKSVMADMDVMIKRFKNFTVNGEKGYNNKNLVERMKIDKKFVSIIVEEIDRNVKKKPMNEWDTLCDYWMERDIMYLVEPIAESLKLNEQILDAGIMQSTKLRNQQREAVRRYLHIYVTRDGDARIYPVDHKF